MRFIFFLSLFFNSLVAAAQVKISGRITDRKNTPLAGMSVTLKGTYDGASTDSLGNYLFHTEEKGHFQLEVTGVSFTPELKELDIDSTDLQINIQLKESSTNLASVIIISSSFEASDKKKGAVLSSLDIVTTASSNGDVTGALRTLPGVSTVGEATGLFVRGGDGVESKIFIDGSLVNNFFYATRPGITSRARFNPFLFSGTQFSTGGYSAQYGQALSSALILETNDVAEHTEGFASLSVVGAGAGYQKLADNKKSSYGVSLNYTNTWPALHLVKQRQQYDKYPTIFDGDINFRIKTKKALWKYYGYFSNMDVTMRDADIDSAALSNRFKLHNLNTFQNLSVRWTLPNRWKVYSVGSFGTDRNKINNELIDAQAVHQDFTTPADYRYKNYGVKTDDKFYQLRSVAEKKLRGSSAIRFGAEHFWSQEPTENTDADNNKYSGTIKDKTFAAFAEGDVYVAKDLAVNMGLRSEHSSLLNEWNIAPRATVAYKTGTSAQLLFSYGKFYQSPSRSILPALSDVPFSAATHYILQYLKTSPGRTLRAETFYKSYDKLYKTESNSFGRSVATNADGKGYAKGFELFYRDKKLINGLDYWISYSFLDTKRDYLNYPGSIAPPFAAAHNVSLAVKKFITGWKTGFNLSHTYQSGRPYYHFVTGNNGKTTIADQGKTKAYNNLSLSVNYLPFLGQRGPKAFSVLVLMVNNVLGFNNVYGYDYGSINPIKVPSLPTSKRFIFIGWFMHFGVDRTQQVIDNNL